jgi:putative CocE/NonD family hydrolase
MAKAIPEPKIVFIKTRDGIELETHLFLPEGGRPGPVLYARTVYSLKLIYPRAYSLCCLGYAVAVQYARGHGGSGGELEKSVPVAEDGYDTISWLTGQPWCDGRVATFGQSALAKTQINLAALGHTSHGAMLLRVPSWGIMEGLGGAWFYSQVLMMIYRTQNGAENPSLDEIDWQSHLERLPVSSAMDGLGTAQDYYKTDHQF